jgi:hypothetical protein
MCLPNHQALQLSSVDGNAKNPMLWKISSHKTCLLYTLVCCIFYHQLVNALLQWCQMCIASVATPACCRLTTMQGRVQAADVLTARAQGWQRRLEQTQMLVEDLEATNARAVVRRQELVSSYWPVMTRLRKAEDAVQALMQQVITARSANSTSRTLQCRLSRPGSCSSVECCSRDR